MIDCPLCWYSAATRLLQDWGAPINSELPFFGFDASYINRSGEPCCRCSANAQPLICGSCIGACCSPVLMCAFFSADCNVSAAGDSFCFRAFLSRCTNFRARPGKRLEDGRCSPRACYFARNTRGGSSRSRAHCSCPRLLPCVVSQTVPTFCSLAF